MTITILDTKIERHSNQAVSDYVSSLNDESKEVASNIDAMVKLICGENMLLPISINNEEYSNSYVCSPYTALVPYAYEEANKINNLFIRGIIKGLIYPISFYLKRNKINQLVSINNWMLSTNLYPENWQGGNLDEMTDLLTSEYPNHGVMFRSLNACTNKNLMASLSDRGYLMVPSRQIYIYNQQQKKHQSRDYKRDCKLLKNTDLNYVSQADISADDIPRIAELYQMLYIKKYSVHNPRFNENYIQILLNNDLFYAEGFRNSEGILDAIGIRFTLGNVTTLPIMGYDTNKPRSLGLYRLISISRSEWANKNNVLINASSGAPSFKRLRGAVPYIEYSAIYIDHLSKPRQRMWRSIAFVLKKFIIPIMKKYKL